MKLPFSPLKKVKELTDFVKNVANDERIPGRDKTVLLAMVALILSPFDIIPDWIPVLGQIDDAILLALILDYLFCKLDTEVLLTHYPWDMKSFLRVKRIAGWVAKLAPDAIKKRIWAYEGSPYK